MTEQRRKLLDEFDQWFNSKPNKKIMAAECANIAERYAAEQLKLHSVSQQRELLLAYEKFKNGHILNATDKCHEANVDLFLSQ